MNFSEKSVVTQKEILKRKLGGELFAPVTLASGAFTNGVCLAGSAIDADGAVVTDDSAVGILVNDVYAENPVGAILKAFGVVNEANCPEDAITSDVKGALPLIVFE